MTSEINTNHFYIYAYQVCLGVCEAVHGDFKIWSNGRTKNVKIEEEYYIFHDCNRHLLC